MLVHKRRSEWVYATALSWRVVLHRFSFALFFTLSLGLLVLGHTRPAVMDRARARFVDTVSPVLDVVARPLAMVDTMTARVQSYRSLLEENARLRTENAALVRWQNAALALENENKELRALLNYKPEPSLAFVTARVIADTGGGFLRSLIITAGSVDGVREGMAAMAGEALIGRVVEVGDWTSRVLLITDMSSRLPVVLMGTGEHAILSGDNTARPKLLYLPQESDVRIGTRVMTSGHGGIFPPNVPVGVVTAHENGAFEVTPMASMGRMNQIRLIDFNLAGGAFNPIAAKIQAAKSPR
ncbi:MAG TPA: rod shape-determining protein MreC [Rhodospirillaceae bacterium]|nr:rod shape-determining protein MreC [Rhodospirillaceae bacterium]